MRGLAVVVVLLLFVLALSGTARAHGMRSGYLELQELSPGHVLARFTLTVPASGVAPRFPAGCSAEPGEGVGASRDAPSTFAPASRDGAAPTTYRLSCAEPLAGQLVGIDGLGPLITECSVLVLSAGGGQASHVLTADEPQWRIPAASAPLAVLRDYARLGAKHIALGVDHLLFLALLVLTLGRLRSVIVAETAFTLSHTLSFSLTATGLVRVSAPAAEACIALSLVLLALDVGRKGARPSDRATAAMAFAFGAVHGLGFAGGLREIGLPEQDVAWALAGFGLGVEAGQVLFLAVAFAVAQLVERTRWRARGPIVAAYAIGGVASWWLIDRTIACFHAG